MEGNNYTRFTGPPKHKKHITEDQKIHSEVYKKSDHCNKNMLDGKKIYKIMNDEEDHKRISSYYIAPPMPQDLRIAIAQARNAKGWNQ